MLSFIEQLSQQLTSSLSGNGKIFFLEKGTEVAESFFL